MSEDAQRITDEEYIQMTMYLPEKIDKCVNLLAERHLKESGIKVYYIPYILHIYHRDGISQKELKATVPYDKSRISVVIHEMVKNGLVIDERSGRNSSLHLTEEGLQKYSACMKFIGILKNELFDISPEEEEIMRQRNMKFDQHLDSLLQRLSEQ